MSIILAGCFKDVAIVAADSYVSGENAPPACGKLEILPYALAAIVSRGSAWLAEIVVSECKRSGLRFDGLTARLPRISLWQRH